LVIGIGDFWTFGLLLLTDFFLVLVFLANLLDLGNIKMMQIFGGKFWGEMKL